MTKDEAMKLALDALLIWEEMHPKTTASAIRIPAIQALQEALEQPDDVEAAVLAEREACAKVCESIRPSEQEFDQRFYTACTLCANAIRARGE